MTFARRVLMMCMRRVFIAVLFRDEWNYIFSKTEFRAQYPTTTLFTVDVPIVFSENLASGGMKYFLVVNGSTAVTGMQQTEGHPGLVQGKSGHKRKIRARLEDTGERTTVYRWKKERKK